MSLTKEDLADFSDEIRELIEPHLDPTGETLESISKAISAKRDEARTARSSSGIEEIWTEAEEAYMGIDDANRAEFQQGRMAKPQTMAAPLTSDDRPKVTDGKSTVFLRLTARYVDAGKAKLCEILLPPNDKSFSIAATPSPDLIKAKDDHRQVIHPELNTPLTRPAQEGEAPDTSPPPGSPMMAAMPSAAGPAASVAGVSPPADDATAGSAAGPGGAVPPGPAGAAQAPRVPLTYADLAKEQVHIANKKAKLAETRIYGWLVKSKYRREMRKVIFDAARCGPGVLKGPFPDPRRGIAVTRNGKDVDVTIKDTVQPGSKRVDFWNLFPDPNCGEDVHDGDFIFERDFLSQRGVRKLKKIPGYISSQIDKVLAEGPQVDKRTDDRPTRVNVGKPKEGRFEVWYYYGMLTREEICRVNEAADEPKVTRADIPESQQQVYALVTMINSTVVRAVINPLDSGSFPYHVMAWQRRAGHWAGVGIGEQLRAPQRMLNASVRAMLNNAGKSAGSQIVMDQGAIRPADGNLVMTPDKVWYKLADSGGTVEDAFQVYEIPNVTEEMMKIIEFAMKQAEEATSIPLVTQGQSGPTTPATFGATVLQDNNANQLLRDLGWEVDDSITESLIDQHYEWLLLDPDVPAEEKGDFTIDAHGSIALVERAIQDQVLVQLPGLSLNAVYGLDPAKCIETYLRSKRINPDDVSYTEDQKATMARQPPPKAPQVQAAEIAASVARDALIMKQKTGDQSIEHERAIHEAELALEGRDTENDLQRIQAERERTKSEATVRLHEIQLKHNTELMRYATMRGISLVQAKKELAKTAMTLQAQERLNAVDHAVDLHKHGREMDAQAGAPGSKKQPKHIIAKDPARPLAQAPGRAPAGKAFSQ